MKMGTWKIIAGHLQLLMLIALSVDMAQLTSLSTTHQMCSDDQYYDADRDWCFDLSREQKCLPHQICTERIHGHQGPYICGDRCFHTCVLPMYCNTETQDCNPCSNICSYSDEDSLRKCRIHCYDIHKEIIASDPQPSTAPLTPTDSGSITRSKCHQEEYYDADRDTCLDMCGEFNCQLHEICSTKVGEYTGPLHCINRCLPICASPSYCYKPTARCDPCLDICNDRSSETLRQCRIYCCGCVTFRYKEIVVCRTSTAALLVSMSSESPPTPDESVFSDLVTKPTQLSPGLVVASVFVPVVICCLVLSTVTLYIRRIRDRRRLSQQRTGKTPPTEDARIELMEVSQQLMEEKVQTEKPRAYAIDRNRGSQQLTGETMQVEEPMANVIDRNRGSHQLTGETLQAEDAMQPTSSIVEIDQFMTQLRESYGQQIKERNEMEKKQYGNVIPLDQHQPVIINHGLKEPDRQKRRTYDEFVTETSDSKHLTLENFLRENGQGRSRSVLMLGGPGMGKTSICYTILDRFVKDRWTDHRYIFLISLKGLVSMATSVSLADILFDYNTALYNRESKETLIKQVKERPKETLIILDGYDECEEFMTNQLNVTDPTAKAKPGAILKNLVSGNMLPHAQVLLTSRPFKSTNENLGVNRVVQITGLTAESVLSLIANNVSSKLDTKTLPGDIVSLLCIPINLQKFLSYLIWIISEFSSEALEFPRTKTSLYSVQMIPVLRQTLRFIDFNPITELEMWNHPLVLDFLRSLAELASTAFDGLDKKQIMFQSRELEQCGLDENSVKQGGLMTSFTKPTQERDGMRHVVYFYFIHLINLEWVGGLHIVNTTLDHIRGLISRNQGQLDVILCFAVGLLGDKNGQVILKRVHGMTSDDCLDKADKILSDILQSDRCTLQAGGHQFALEVYHEGQFTRPHLLLPLLAPDGHELVMTGLANYNRDAVHYFLSQLTALQDGQTEQTEAATEISNIDTMMLHFTREAKSTVQEGFLREVGRLKKLKYLSIKTDGEFKAAVEQPLELLTVHGRMDEYDAAHIIENSSASVLCLLITNLRRSASSLSASVHPAVKELHLRSIVHSLNSMTIEGTNTLLAVTGLLYDQDKAPTALRLIEKNIELKAIGLDIRTKEDVNLTELTRVLKHCQNIQSIALNFLVFNESHLAMTLAILNEMTSLQEIWLSFLMTWPDDNQLARLGQKVCSHTMLSSVSLLSGFGDINILAFLKVLSDKNRCLSIVYTDQPCQLECDLLNRAAGRLVNVNLGWESMFYTPLVNSPYLLTSVPSHTKSALRKRYLSKQI